jgi:hypothetical protein
MIIITGIGKKRSFFNTEKYRKASKSKKVTNDSHATLRSGTSSRIKTIGTSAVGASAHATLLINLITVP